MPKPKDLQKFTSSYAKDFSEHKILGKSKKDSVSKSFGVKDFRAILQKTTAVSLDSVPKKKSKVKRKLKALSTHTHGEKSKHELKNVQKKKILHQPKDDFIRTSRKKDIAATIKEKRKDKKIRKEQSSGHRSPRRLSPILKLSRHQSPIHRLSRHQSPMPRMSMHRSPMPRVSMHRSPIYPVSNNKRETKQKINNIVHTSSDGSFTVESFEETKSTGDKPIYCSKENDLEELNSVIKTLDSGYYQNVTPKISEYDLKVNPVNVSRSDQYMVQAPINEKQSMNNTLRALLKSSGTVDIDDSMVVKLLEESLVSAIKKGDIALADVKGGFSSATSSDTASLKMLHYEEVVHSYSDTVKTVKKNFKGKKSIERPATVDSTLYNTTSQKNIKSILCPSSKKSGYRQLNDILIDPDIEIEDFFQKVQTYVQTFPGWLQTKAKKKIFNLVIGLDVYRKKYGRKI